MSFCFQTLSTCLWTNGSSRVQWGYKSCSKLFPSMRTDNVVVVIVFDVVVFVVVVFVQKLQEDWQCRCLYSSIKKLRICGKGMQERIGISIFTQASTNVVSIFPQNKKSPGRAKMSWVELVAVQLHFIAFWVFLCQSSQIAERHGTAIG